MKSKILLSTLLTTAIATSAGAALAQTSVTMEGVADGFAGSMRNSGDAASTSKVGSGGLSTSYIGFKGIEDLGGGLKASFTLGAFYRIDDGASGRFNGDTFFARDANVALSNQYGKITLGRMTPPTTLPLYMFNPIEDSFTLSPLVLHAIVGTSVFPGTFGKTDSAWSNSIRYTSPTFAGITVNLHYQFGEAAGNSSKNNKGANVLYQNGALGLGLAYHDVQVGNPLDNPIVPNGPSAVLSVPVAGGPNLVATRQKLTFVGASYDLSFVKLFATYDRATHNIDLKDQTATLGVSVPAGSGNILGAVAQTKRESAVFDDLKRTTVSVGYDYFLSKRTDLYAFVMSDKTTNYANAGSFAVGMRHRF